MNATDGGGWRLVLQTRVDGEPGRRELLADDCGSLAEAASLILALAIDPQAVRERQEVTDRARRVAETATPVSDEEPKEEKPTETADEESEAEAPPEESREPREPPTPLAFSLGPALLADVGSLPGVAVGVGITGGVEIDRLRLEVSGGFWPLNEAELDVDPDKGGKLGLWAVGGGACYRVVGEVLSLSPCARS